MFNHLCNQPWMDIIFPYLLTDKLGQERHTPWLFPSISLSTCVSYVHVLLHYVYVSIYKIKTRIAMHLLGIDIHVCH